MLKMPGKYWVIHGDYSLPIRQLPRLWWLFCILPNTRCTPRRQDVSNIDKMLCTEVVSPGQQGSLLQQDVLMPVSQLPALSLAQGHSLGLSTVMNMTGPACRTHQWQGALPYQTVWERGDRMRVVGQPLTSDCLELLFLFLSGNTVGVGLQTLPCICCVLLQMQHWH